MDAHQHSPHVTRFGDFEVDLRAGELRRGGQKIKLQQQPFRVLALLLEHPGQVVTREELRRAIWPGTFVEFNEGLDEAIYKLRSALADSADAPRFVETLPRRGYRFIGVLDDVVTSAGGRDAPPIEPARPAAVHRGSHRTASWIGVGALTAAAAVLGLVALRHQPPTVFVPGRVVVAPLEVPAHDSALSEFARGLAATLPEAIAREGVAEPVPDATVGDVLAHATGLPGDVAERLARETGAGLELRGRCSRAPGGTTCEVNVLRMPAKVLRMSVGATGDPSQPAFEAELTERVLVALLLQRTYGDRVTWLGEYLPRSLAALRAFESGYDLEWGDDSSPDHYYVEAARLDSAWVLPAALHVRYTRDTASLKRLAARPGLLPGEREAAEYILAAIRRDPERSFELAQRRFAVNPEWWLYLVTFWAYATGRANTALAVSGYADSAVHVADRALRSTEWIRGFALHQLGRYQDQLRLARDFERRFPDNQLRERTNEVMALAGLGEVDSVRRRLAEWAAIPEPKNGPRTRAVVAGNELMAHGKEREGRELLATALPLFRRIRKTEGCTCDEVAILEETDQLDETENLGRADLPTVKSMADSMGYLEELAVIAARRGRPEEAAQYDRLLARAQQRPGLTGDIMETRAEIASVVGDREGAVRLLEEARARGAWSAAYQFVHRDPDFFPLRGYPPFERFLNPRS